jgi:very-short-patch-repair endonuclease
MEELQKGIGFLEQISQITKKLSVSYNDQVDQLNVTQLQRDWIKAEKTIWPISWWCKRKVRAVLESAISGDGEPEVARDIHSLVQIRALRADVGKFEIGPATEGVWVGLKTRTEFAAAALRFQRTLNAVRREELWEDEGFEAIANGRCGERLEKELSSVRILKLLDVEIGSLEGLASATSGVWAGLATRLESLEAAMGFNAALQSVRESGALEGNHDLVARSECGAAMAADFQRLRQRTELEHKLSDMRELTGLTAGLWKGLSTRIDEIEKAIKFQTSISAAIANLAATPEDIDAFKVPLDRLIGQGNALLESTGPIASASQGYLDAWGALQPAMERLVIAGEFTEESKTSFVEMPLDTLAQRCADIIQAEPRLHAWCAWCKVRQQAVVLGLSPLIVGIENASVAQGLVRRAFETNYSRWWLNVVVDNEPVIRTFVSAEHEKRIGDFRALDERFTTLTRAWVRAALCADLPKQDEITRNSEWGVLRHEMTKKKQHMPLRELMTTIPSVLTRLTPCLLMSPLSIAQYLAADTTAFDVVVFDEASQIPVWDAIGAIARGKQVVMVGDPKQLPPTNFFDRAESSFDDEDVEGDLESILDECLGASLPTMNLTWHYRSRHESLIAFSNHRYYHGSLVTFPSPVTEDRAVSFHYVKGVYEKGGARINKPEAKALVADIVARLKSPGFRESGLTIGVVTFNSEQQALIEDLLDNERRRDPSIEPYFVEVELEPLFVKNLESVQGDERDIMYFSITYGPDLAGAVSMNFGPMNREGGERRLNVAITRARHELRVFSSLKGEQMDLARTQALGVRDLKHFLEFAERGPRALAEATWGSLGDFESPFEEAVAAALTSKGWELHPQIGASAFRVDLAVVHPDARGVYLAGIECDGATYHRSATARDRDMLREQVLRGLGWEILRVWSTDWWLDKAGTLAKLDTRLRAILQFSRTKRVELAEKEAVQLAAEMAIAKVGQDTGHPPDQALRVSRIPGVTQTELALGEAIDGDAQFSQEETDVYARNSAAVKEVPSKAFVESNPLAAVEAVDVDAFFNHAYDAVLQAMIAHVVAVEGPVMDAVLARRIARAHGWQRTGARIQERVKALAAKTYRVTEEDVGTFYWPMDRGPGTPLVFRKAADDAVRPVDEVCIQELIALAQVVLAMGATADMAIIAMARALGLQKLRATSRGRFEKAIVLANGG